MLIESALIFFNWAEEKNDGIVHEGKGLAGFPVAEKTIFVDFVLGFGENTDEGVTPIGIGTISVCHDDGLGFIGKLGIFVKVDAVKKELRIKGKDFSGRTVISLRKGMEEQMTQKMIGGSETIRRRGRTKAEAFGKRHRKQEWVGADVVFGCNKRKRLSAELERKI